VTWKAWFSNQHEQNSLRHKLEFFKEGGGGGGGGRRRRRRRREVNVMDEY
jgi:hypothetical protein